MCCLTVNENGGIVQVAGKGLELVALTVMRRIRNDVRGMRLENVSARRKKGARLSKRELGGYYARACDDGMQNEGPAERRQRH